MTIKKLWKYSLDTEIEVMVGFSIVPVRSVSGNDNGGVYLEIEEEN